MKYTVASTTSLDPRLRTSWKKLWDESRHATLFNSPDWYDYALSLEPQAQPIIFTCFHNSDLVGIMPLVTVSCFGIPALVPLAAYYAVDKPYLVSSYEPDLLEAFFGSIFSKGNVHIPKMDEDIARMLARIFPKAFFSLISVNPYIDLSFEPLRFLSTNDAKEMRRLIRKYSDSIEFKIYTGKDLKRAVERMFEIDTHSGKEKKGMDIFSNRKAQDAFRGFVQHLNSYIQIAMLLAEEKPIGYVFCFLYKDVFLPYQASYLFESRKLSPGKMIMYRLLDSLRDSSFSRFDFSGGISSYKREFTKQFYLQYNLYYSDTVVISLWWKSVNAVRRLKQVLFPLANTNDHLYLFKSLSVQKEKL